MSRTSPLRIGVNALYLIPGGVGGTEIYLRGLLAACQQRDHDTHEFVLFTNEETGETLVPAHERFITDVQPVRATNRPRRIVWEQSGLVRAVRRQRIDVLLNPGFTAPRWPGCPSVTVFHDLQHKRHPEHFRWFDLPFWQLLLWQSARHSDALIAVSEATRRDLQSFYQIAPERITVVPHGVEPEFFSVGSQRRPEPYLLCVSTLHPHKNLERLLRAFALFKREHPGIQLVLAGMRGFRAAHLEKLAGELGLGGAVRFTGWIPREELYSLFQHASAFVYPSTFEGFGMPVLEALAAGVPTVCSDIPPLREVAGEDAALYFDPLDEHALAVALDRIVEDEALKQRLSTAGPPRARQFTWERAAALTIDVLERVASAK